MRFLKSEGIIINRLVLKDSDLLLTIFTPKYGKILCYARGARNLKSSRVSKLNTFYRIKFEIIDKQNRKILTHTDLISSYKEGKKNLNDIRRIFEIGELINELIPENQPNLEIYNLLVTALENIHKFSTPQYIYRFKIRILHSLGYGGENLSPTDIDRYIESIIEKPLKTTNIF